MLTLVVHSMRLSLTITIMVCHLGQPPYPLTTTPPLQWMVCPLMQELSLLARKTAQLAISDGCAGLPIGLVNSF